MRSTRGEHLRAQNLGPKALRALLGDTSHVPLPRIKFHFVRSRTTSVPQGKRSRQQNRPRGEGRVGVRGGPRDVSSVEACCLPTPLTTTAIEVITSIADFFPNAARRGLEKDDRQRHGPLALRPGVSGTEHTPTARQGGVPRVSRKRGVEAVEERWRQAKAETG